jgi:F-type H+-transporting ATPase subunit alpha
MEVLKQNQYVPMPVEEQVVSLYVGVENHLADVDVGEVRRFIEEWLSFLHSEHEEIFDELRAGKEFTDSIETQLGKAVSEFKERFGG